MDATDCCDFEAFLALGIALFNWIKGCSRAAQDAIARSELKYAPEVLHAFADAYREWLKPCPNVERAIRWFESRGYRVEKAEEFRAAVSEISLHDFDVEDIIKASNDTENGAGIPLAEAIGSYNVTHCSSKGV